MFKVVDAYTKDCVLNLHWNIYGQKQAGRVCNHYLTKILINKVGFEQSSVDNFVLCKVNVMYVFYTYESIFSGLYKYEVNQVIHYISGYKTQYHNRKRSSGFLGNKHWYQARGINQPYTTSPDWPNIGKYKRGENNEDEIKTRIKLLIVLKTHWFSRI